MSIELSVIMPCLNEARTVSRCIHKARMFMARYEINGEVIIADNGSQDGSPDIAKTAGARVISVVQKGYGCALRGGIEVATGKYIIMGDADDSYDFATLDRFVDLLRGGCDMVMGNRFSEKMKPGAMPPLHRYLGNPVLSFIGRLFFRTRIRDFHCGLRGFTREAYARMHLVSEGMEFASEIVLKAGLLGMRIVETPVILYPDGRDRKPHLRSWHDGWRHLKLLFIFCPRWLFLYPCLIFMMIGLVTGIALLPGRLQVGQVALDVHTLFYSGVFVTLGCIGLWFYLFGRIYAQLAGYCPMRQQIGRIVDRLTIERGLLIGGSIFLSGIVGSCYALWQWKQQDFSSLNPQHMLRIVIPSGFAIINGALLALAALFFQVLRSGSTPVDIYIKSKGGTENK